MDVFVGACIEIRDVSEIMMGSSTEPVGNGAGGRDVGGGEIGLDKLVSVGVEETSASTESFLDASSVGIFRSVCECAIVSSNSFRGSRASRRSMAPCIRSSVSKLITPSVK